MAAEPKLVCCACQQEIPFWIVPMCAECRTNSDLPVPTEPKPHRQDADGRFYPCDDPMCCFSRLPAQEQGI